MPGYKLINKALGMSDCCVCLDPSYYVFFTTILADHPPIICGDCDLPVPLYRFPKLDGEEEYYNLRCWERSYEACDNLFMNTNVGVRYGYRQISNAKSELTIEGMKLQTKWD